MDSTESLPVPSQPTPEERLYSLARASSTSAILIDRMAPIADDGPLAGALEALPVIPLSDPIFKAMEEHSPALLIFDRTTLEPVEMLLDAAMHAAEAEDPMRAVCAFVFTDSNVQALACCMTRNLDTFVPGTGRVYFRYFDPRVWGHLEDILTAPQRALLFGPISSWMYIDARAQLCCDAAPEQLTEDCARVLSLTKQQWARCERIPVLNGVGQRLRAMRWHGDSTQIDHRLILAQRAHLPIPDQIAYATYSLMFGERFDRHEQLGEAIEAALEHGISFEDIMIQRLGLVLGDLQTG